MALKIKIKELNECDFINYKKPSMFIVFPYCSFKCEKECGKKICQNSSLIKEPIISIDIKTIVNKYINNPLTQAIVCGGLEPFDSWEELSNLIVYLRMVTKDDIVIYTGYREEEISSQKIRFLENAENIIVKFGRFIPDQKSHYDDILGIKLASDNQYGKKMVNKLKIRQVPNTDNIKQAVKDNEGYCPCRILKNENTKCMCKEFREMEEGVCHCGLYEKIK